VTPPGTVPQAEQARQVRAMEAEAERRQDRAEVGERWPVTYDVAGMAVR
jgi:hypothetical protein